MNPNMQLTILEILERVKGEPWAPAGVMQGEQPIQVPKLPAGEEDPLVFAPSRCILTKNLFEKIGYTSTCRKCILMQRNDARSGKLTHDETCRERIENLMTCGHVIIFALVSDTIWMFVTSVRTLNTQKLTKGIKFLTIFKF